MLRIIAGKFRGRLLDQPDINNTRSTTDRVKESIFNCIQNEIEGKIILDLFSGSGSMAIESISRGAMKAICVDNSLEAISIIKKNSEKLKINNINIYHQNCLDFLKSKKGTKYDIVFLDPPYQNIVLLNEVLNILSKDLFVNKYGKIIIENTNFFSAQIVIPKKMIIDKEKNYGQTKIIFLNNVL